MSRTRKNERGLTLVEVLVALALGVVVLGSAFTLFKKAMDMSVTMGQRAEMQQNARAGINAMVRDLSLAATDLPSGSIQLPQSLAPLQPRFGCAMGGICYLTNGNNIFQGGTMYYVNPHPKDGAVVGTITPDSLVIVYADPDPTIALGQVVFSPANDLTGSAITVSVPPANIASQVNGITKGDLIWLNNVNGNAIGVVTDFDGVDDIKLAAAPDPLNINQPPTEATPGAVIAGNVNGNITSNLMNQATPPPNPPVIPGANGVGAQITAQRIFLVVYFIQQDATGRRMLMRQVNAHPATAVAENVENLQVTYDTIDTTVTPPVPVVNQANPAGSPNLIRKVNIALTVRTTQKVGAFGDYQRLTLATSVSPRNMSTTAIF
jgi:prepilin-type N-terminal cleavage/methylation domain-containing protein